MNDTDYLFNLPVLVVSLTSYSYSQLGIGLAMVTEPVSCLPYGMTPKLAIEYGMELVVCRVVSWVVSSGGL
jgi:hypothetical protein